jgi:hypothetical protein
MGTNDRPNLAPMMNYIKLVDQILIEPIGILRNVDTQIMGILTSIDFDLINLVEGILAYADLVGRSWFRRMKETISLERDRIKLKGSGRKIIILLDLKEGKPWMDSWDEDE